MGSLMSGWDSPVLDPKKAKYQRNKSLTRGEIDAFWRSKKQEEGGGGGGGAQSQPETPSGRPSKENLQLENIKKEAVRRYRRSTSMPLPDRRNNLWDDVNGRAQGRYDAPPAVASAAAKLPDPPENHGCWWTASSWAFLNEAPVMPEPSVQSRRPYVTYSSSSKFCASHLANPEVGEAAGHRQIST